MLKLIYKDKIEIYNKRKKTQRKVWPKNIILVCQLFL